MYIWSGLHLFAVITYLYLSIYVVAINHRDYINRACVAAMFCMGLWCLELMIVHFPHTSYETARVWVNIGALGWIGFSPSILGFVALFTGHGHWGKKWWYHAVTTLPFIVFYIAQWHWLIVGELVARPYGWTHTWSTSIWFPLFCVYYVGMIGWSLFLLAQYQRRTQRRTLKALSRMLFATIFTCLVVGSITDTILPMLELRWIPTIGPLVTLLWAAGLTYALVKYKFLTITPATAADNILATMSDLLILCDPHGRIVTVNHAVAETLGYTRMELEGEPLLRYIDDPNARNVRSFSRSFGKLSVENVRMNLSKSNGRMLPVMLSSSLLTDDRGELAGTVTVAKDITALERAEMSLRSSEKRHRDLVENINDVIFTINRAGIVTYVSPRIKALADYTPEELIGRRIGTLVPEEEHPEMMAQIKRAFKENLGATNHRLIKKDGTHAWVRVSGRPIWHNGNSIGMQGVLADITRLMRAMEEKLELEAKLNRAQKMEAIGTLAGGVAHDLNNILGGIASYPEFLLMNLSPDSELRKPLELIKDSGMKAATIVQDLLTLARRGVANFEPLNLNRIIDDFLVSPEYQKQRSFFPMATVTVHLASDLNHVKGSSVHLTKSVMNLMSNAFEALQEEGRIEITTQNRHFNAHEAEKLAASPGDYVQLRVQDNGMGIAPQDLDRIFEPFYTKKVMGRSGTGLGMAVVWGTVHDHKGFIDVQSEPGQGACFDLYFPVSRDELLVKAGPPPRRLYQGRGETILVVDDVAEQRTVASAMLSELGYHVETASSGEAAEAAIRKEAVDLVVLDMIMDPGMDGLETFEKILAIRPEQKAILASGYSETDRARRALELGALCYLKKPYSLASIGIAVRNALDLRIS